MNPAILDAYDELMWKALFAHPTHADFITGLHRSWYTRLTELPDVNDPHVDTLLREIGLPDIDPDALLRWLDLFPEVVESKATEP